MATLPCTGSAMITYLPHVQGGLPDLLGLFVPQIEPVSGEKVRVVTYLLPQSFWGQHYCTIS